jgi:hypothetical protein
MYDICDGRKFLPVDGTIVVNDILRQQMEPNQ